MERTAAPSPPTGVSAHFQRGLDLVFTYSELCISEHQDIESCFSSSSFDVQSLEIRANTDVIRVIILF